MKKIQRINSPKEQQCVEPEVGLVLDSPEALVAFRKLIESIKDNPGLPGDVYVDRKNIGGNIKIQPEGMTLPNKA